MYYTHRLTESLYVVSGLLLEPNLYLVSLTLTNLRQLNADTSTRLWQILRRRVLMTLRAAGARVTILTCSLPRLIRGQSRDTQLDVQSLQQFEEGIIKPHMDTGSSGHLSKRCPVCQAACPTNSGPYWWEVGMHARPSLIHSNLIRCCTT